MIFLGLKKGVYTKRDAIWWAVYDRYRWGGDTCASRTVSYRFSEFHAWN